MNGAVRQKCGGDHEVFLRPPSRLLYVLEIAMFEFKRAARALGRGFSKIFSAYLSRRAIAPLLYANERMLSDIGLSRHDIVDSLSGPLCADPSQLLIARIDERRTAARADAHFTAAKPQRGRPKHPLAA
jgi:uncharacterized protein YjiS (DUF1127 family)